MSRGAASFQALPHSEESERAVLAAILLSPSLLDQVNEVLETKDFYLDKHQLIYSSMLGLWSDGHPIDLRTLQARLELKNGFELIGGLTYLTGLDAMLPDLSRIMSYVDIVKERSARRHLMAMADNVSSACVSSGLEAKAIVAEAERTLATIWVGESSEWVSAKEAFEENDQIRKDQLEGRIPTVTSGVYALDVITGPWEAGELIVIGGNPKMGKSSFARQLLLHFSKFGPVIFATLEEPVNQVMPKMACAHGDVDFKKWRERRLDDDEEERYWRAREAVISKDVRLIGVGTKKLNELSWPGIKRIFRKSAKKGGKASCVDFLQKLTTERDRVAELSRISNEYSMLGLQTNTISVLVSQLNRGNAKRTNKKAGEKEKWEDHVPIISDFEGAGGIEQAGHKLIFPMRPAYFEPDNVEFRSYGGMEKAKIILAGNRNGPIGTAEVWWKGSTMTYWDTVQQGAPW